MRRKRLTFFLIVAIGFSGLFTVLGRREAFARAEHFGILLAVSSGGQSVQAFTDETPPEGGLNKRPVLTVMAGSEIQVHWRMECEYPHGVLKNVGVHFFVVHEQKAGQKPVPDPSGSAGVVDNSFTMDFKPHTVATGMIRFRITDPGTYLIRIQSENTYQIAGHEHFSAVDLVVQ
ncbi:hypothetical protein CWRG_00744 [Chthonomonas calidirosea]|uniref:hypothetical protein n=1 Tax=Chthonomonas calidirosea TaxID=454171 RepID=UPI0006DD4D31|nr:hypothetical protein [Chthonomonas calidirosea]CEK14183.1 hypothetical protein CWRG_00744 [Chthonomonas calidirosea]CEK14184.1 hypothetical protein CP488_00753 [Chthonomonas calidirosea]